jgi:hypothetical protein
MVLGTEYVKGTDASEVGLAAWSKAYSADFINKFGNWKTQTIANTDVNGEPSVDALFPDLKSSKVKEGVDFVFEQNPELASIGTQEQYSEYLDTIFPDSKIKDIVYHDGGKGKIKEEGFRKDLIGISDGGVLANGFYFYFDRLKKYDENRSHTESVLLNTKNPKTPKQIKNKARVDNYEKAIEILSDVKINPKIKGTHGKYIGNYAEGLSKVGIDAVYSYKRSDEINLKNQFFTKVLNIINVDNIKNLYKDSDIKINSFKITDIELGNNTDFIITIENQDEQRTAFNLRLDGVYNRLKISEGSKTIKDITADLSDKKTAIDVLIEEYKTNEPTTQPSQIVVFEPEQIHILGSKQDIEGFKKFVSGGQLPSTVDSIINMKRWTQTKNNCPQL